jgi:hypothetical protein
MSHPPVTPSEIDAAVDALRAAVGDAMELEAQQHLQRHRKLLPPELRPAEPPAPVVYTRPRLPDLMTALDLIRERYRELRALARRAGVDWPPAPDMRPVLIEPPGEAAREVPAVFTREGWWAWDETIRRWRDDAVDQLGGDGYVPNSGEGRGQGALPRWDRAGRQLQISAEGKVTFDRAAPAQFRVLDALQAAGWPEEGIGLPRGLDRKQAKDSIRQLNSRVLSLSMHFYLDGKGEDGRIRWHVVRD